MNGPSAWMWRSEAPSCEHQHARDLRRRGVVVRGDEEEATSVGEGWTDRQGLVVVEDGVGLGAGMGHPFGRQRTRRMATSEDERRAHALIRASMVTLGLTTETHAFKFNTSLYANLALHFGLGTIGSLVGGRAPALGLALHALSAGSYALDSSRRAFLLRRLFPFRDSQNVLGTLPARGEPRLRIVFLAHADAAFTGKVFEPAFTRFAKPGPLHKSLRIATGAVAGLAAVDVAQLVFGRSRALSLLRGVLSVPPLLATLLNLDVVLRDQIVPGATQAIIALGATVEYFRDTVFNYPTLAEAYKVAALDGLNKLAH